MLKFLGVFISLWIDIHIGDINPESCLLSQIDSMTTAGCCFNETQQPTQMDMAHHLAWLIIEARCLYSQWFLGEENDLTDHLSRNIHLNLFSSIPEQIPPGFNIQCLPSAISLWLISLLQMQPETTQLPKPPQQSKLALGAGGLNTSHPLVFIVTPSLTNSPEDNAIISSVDLLMQHDQGVSVHRDLP